MNLHVLKAACLYFQRDYEGAVRAADRALALDRAAAWEWRYRALLVSGGPSGRLEGIRALVSYLGSWTPRSEEAIAARAEQMAGLLAARGLSGPLEQFLQETASPDAATVHAYNRATWQMLLRKPKAALSELETGLSGKSFQMVYLAVDPVFEPLHDDPRFHAVLAKLGLGLVSDGQAASAPWTPSK